MRMIADGTTCHRDDGQRHHLAEGDGDFRFLYRGRVYDLCNQRNRAYSRRQGHQIQYGQVSMSAGIYGKYQQSGSGVLHQDRSL